MMIMTSKEVQLKDGSIATLRPTEEKDRHRLYEYFASLPMGDRHLLNRDLATRAVFMNWFERMDPERFLSMVACQGRKVIGEGRLYFHQGGWQSHISEISCTVARHKQRIGLGTRLAHALVEEAVHRQVRKAKVLCIEHQSGWIKALEKLGFACTASLPGHIIDVDGNEGTLVVLTIGVSELLQHLEDLIVGQDLGGGR